VKLLKKGEPVFFDCDVTQGLNRSLGVLDNDLFEYDLLFDTSFEWERPERMAYLHQRPTHCMVLIGVDLVNGRPAKWKIENSWGDELGHKGLFQMSDEWFEEHVYGLTVHRTHLGKKLRKLFDQEPVALPPWHTLA
jgi:bleomycin hydrolase